MRPFDDGDIEPDILPPLDDETEDLDFTLERTPSLGMPAVDAAPPAPAPQVLDVNQTHTMRQRKPQPRQRGSLWNTLSLIATVVFALAAVVVLILPGNQNPQPDVVPPTLDIPTALPTDLAETPDADTEVGDNENLTSLEPEIAEQLNEDSPLIPREVAFGVDTGQNDPFTIAANRSRVEFVNYVAQQGDTINAIAEGFGLEPETLAWCNDNDVVFTLRPGDTLSIPPTNGACHRVLGTRGLTITEIAAEYDINDPFDVIDSPYNEILSDLSPDTVLPSGTVLFLPGGIGPVITWDKGYEVVTEGGGSGGGGITYIVFGSNWSGSCGRVPAAGGSAWFNPIPSGLWMRGFFAGHSGIDMAAPEGTPVYAANGGPVLFSGWTAGDNYGNAVVLAHGAALSTLYAHLSSINVSCGQQVSAGQVIGTVGTTGNSTGPHLHFEIRSNNIPQNPVGTPGLGW